MEHRHHNRTILLWILLSLLLLAIVQPAASSDNDDDGEEQQLTPTPSTTVKAAAQEEAPFRDWWYLHGILAALAWGIAAPIAILTAFLGRRRNNWFAIHQTANMANAGLTLLAFLTAIKAMWLNQQRFHFWVADRFNRAHCMIGLVLVVLTTIQVTGGLLRPHKTTTTTTTSAMNKNTTTTATARQLWEYGHRCLGWILALTAIGWQVPSGIQIAITKWEETPRLLLPLYAMIWIAIVVWVGWRKTSQRLRNGYSEVPNTVS